jgi:putative heme-binding domain-containing protein
LTEADVWLLRSDVDPNVRIQLAHSLRDINVSTTNLARTQHQEALVFVNLALKDIGDPLMRMALLAGMEPHHLGTAFDQLARSQSFRGMAEGPAFVVALAEIVAADPNGLHAATLQQIVGDLARGTRYFRPDATTARAVLRAVRTRGSSQTQTMFDDPNTTGYSMKPIYDLLLKEAVLTAKDSRKPVEARVAAIRDLQITQFREISPVLTEAVKATQPPEVQVAALEALGRFGDDAAPAIILGAWPGMTPKVRATATEILLSRNNWITAFLDAVESRTVARSDIDPARIALLKKSPTRSIGIRATKLFAAPADRQKVFEEYRKSLDLKGDPVKGKLVFKNQCSACHKLEGVGEEVGADLKAIRDRGMEGVLLAILDPNREVKPQFLAYSAELKNMRVVTGLLSAETASNLTIRRADGMSESIARSDVETFRSLGLSYMPEGVEKQIDIQAMADLLAYLNSIK